MELMVVFLLRHNRSGTSRLAGALDVMLADDKPIILALPGRYGPSRVLKKAESTLAADERR
jgi:hypothetical protein